METSEHVWYYFVKLFFNGHPTTCCLNIFTYKRVSEWLGETCRTKCSRRVCKETLSRTFSTRPRSSLTLVLRECCSHFVLDDCRGRERIQVLGFHSICSTKEKKGFSII